MSLVVVIAPDEREAVGMWRDVAEAGHDSTGAATGHGGLPLTSTVLPDVVAHPLPDMTSSAVLEALDRSPPLARRVVVAEYFHVRNSDRRHALRRVGLVD